MLPPTHALACVFIGIMNSNVVDLVLWFMSTCRCFLSGGFLTLDTMDYRDVLSGRGVDINYTKVKFVYLLVG
ncbi:hypothetical protein F5X96DRAFT_648112, partial [Biscogniauxia mediterranea]